MKITDQQIAEIAKNNGLTFAILKAFIDVESGGNGFNTDGKIIIQFEPVWFKRKVSFAPSGKWSINKVENQRKEWEAFNSAFAINPEGAMWATSIGIGQIMGFHFKSLGYKTVGAMWDDAKRGEYQQVLQMVRFIKSKPALFNALKARNWHTVAMLYNGAGYMELAKRIGREPYNISLEKAHKKHSN